MAKKVAKKKAKQPTKDEPIPIGPSAPVANQLTLNLRQRRKLVKAIVLRLDDADTNPWKRKDRINWHFNRGQGVGGDIVEGLEAMGYEIVEISDGKPKKPTPKRFYLNGFLGDATNEWLYLATNKACRQGKHLATAAKKAGLPINEAVARAMVNLSLLCINGKLPAHVEAETLIQE